MKISIKEIEEALKEVFKGTAIQNTESVYEKIEGSDNLKLIIFINRMLNNSINVFYTKLIFVVDKEKKYLINSAFSYLYDINCVYYRIDFNDIEELKSKLKNIFTKNKFGKTIEILSKFIEKPTFLINEWFSKNEVKDISVLGLKYEPKINIMPCESLSFNFVMNVNNTTDVELIIRKEKEGSFVYNFKINDENITVEKPNLSTLIETIGDTLKNNLIK